MFLIESNIRMPGKNKKIVGANTAKYPWRQMQIGDSFFVKPEPHETISKLQARMGCNIHWQNKNTYRQFTQRIWTDEKTGISGTRVWRTS